MLRLITFILLLSPTFAAFAQDDESPSKKLCNEDINKKAIALWEKGTDKKKNKKPERLEFLMKAIQMEPDFAEAHLAMGLELAARAKLENKSFASTLPFFY